MIKGFCKQITSEIVSPPALLIIISAQRISSSIGVWAVGVSTLYFSSLPICLSKLVFLPGNTKIFISFFKFPVFILASL